MGDLFWILMLIPLAWPFVAKVFLHATLNWTEVFLNALIATALTGGLWQMGLSSQTSDVELLNGQVVSKARESTICSHTYKCRCTTRKTSSGDTRRECDTCREHSRDYDWVVRSDVGSFEISRIDRQGRHEPPRYSAVEIGEPVALEHPYTNWVKAASHSLFHKHEASSAMASIIPEYPEVYDYHRADRVLVVGGVDLPDLAAWNADLAGKLRRIGPERQGNVVVVIAPASGNEAVGPEFADHLEAAWLGGKKNDTVVAIGVDATVSGASSSTIVWARSFGWSRDEMLHVLLRDRLIDLGRLERKGVLGVIETTVLEHFERMPMAEFEHLQSEVEPPTWAVILALLAATVGSGLLTFLFHRHDVALFRRGRGAFPRRSFRIRR